MIETGSSPVSLAESNSNSDYSYVSFKRFPEAREWVNDMIALKFIEKYIIHYQDVRSGDYLLLWVQLNDFLQATEEFRTAKASLLFQKYLKRDAYRYVGFVKAEDREKVATLLDIAMQEDASPIPKDTFKDIMEDTENLLIQRVFKGFYNSSFYKEYKKAVVLSSNL